MDEEELRRKLEEIENNEVWKDIPSALGYEISNQGRVRSKRFNKILINSLLSGYYYVSVERNGRGELRPKRVSSLVAEAFLGPRPLGIFDVHHRDGDKRNDWLYNLEYISRVDHMKVHLSQHH